MWSIFPAYAKAGTTVILLLLLDIRIKTSCFLILLCLIPVIYPFRNFWTGGMIMMKEKSKPTGLV